MRSRRGGICMLVAPILPKHYLRGRFQHLMWQERGTFVFFFSFSRTRSRARLNSSRSGGGGGGSTNSGGSGQQLGSLGGCSLQLFLGTRRVGLQAGCGLSLGSRRTGPQPLKRACTNLVEVAHDSRQALVVEVWLRGCDAGPGGVESDLIQAILLCRGRPGLLVNTVHGEVGRSELFSMDGWWLGRSRDAGKQGPGPGGKTGRKEAQKETVATAERAS